MLGNILLRRCLRGAALAPPSGGRCTSRSSDPVTNILDASTAESPYEVAHTRSVTSNSSYDVAEKDFRLQKALIVRKVTRYEYEKFHLKPDLSEEKLEEHVKAKGSDYAALRKRHDEYYRCLDEIQNHFTKRGIEYKLIHRYEYGRSFIDWADAIFTAGGDGTFLMSASKVDGHSKPVIGFNTDPARSEGFVCLPKKYSKNIGGALERILHNDFKWLWRQRIRLTMTGVSTDEAPVDLHNSQLLFPEHRFWEHVQENEEVINERHQGSESEGEEITSVAQRTSDDGQIKTLRLPVLALNEVFIGESLSARVSFYEVSIDGGRKQKQKSSGIMVCPGTGSTSWYFNISNITKMTTKEILRIAQEMRGCTDAKVQDDAMLDKIVDQFNDSLIFSPSENKMAFCIRDPLRTGIFQADHPRGFCKKIWVKSRMYDACVVVDGSLSYRFNHGSVVDMELHESDALRCITLCE